MMMIRFRPKNANADWRTLVWIACVLCLNAAGASAAPYAQPGQAFQSWRERAAPPFIRAGLCGDGEPCPAYDAPYAARPAHARRWEPEPAPYPYEERLVIHPKPDCVEEPYAVHVHVPVVHEPEALPRSPETYDEPCGIRCWYKRLRAGYCGRGCDYYRFRMTQFPEGKLGADRVRVTCR